MSRRHVTVTLTDAQAVEILVALDYFTDSTDLWPVKYRIANAAARAIEAARSQRARPARRQTAGP